MAFKPGQSGNPGGLTPEQRKHRDLVRQMLMAPELTEAWREGYLKALTDGDGTILVDFANRVLGKPKDVIEATGAEGEPLIPPSLSGAQLTEFIELLRANRGKK